MRLFITRSEVFGAPKVGKSLFAEVKYVFDL